MPIIPIPRIDNNEPPAVPSLWNKRYEVIEANFNELDARIPQPNEGDRDKFLRGDGCWADAVKFSRIALDEGDWTQDDETSRYSYTITKNKESDTCAGVYENGNQVLVNITATDTTIILTAMAPITGYAVISG